MLARACLIAFAALGISARAGAQRMVTIGDDECKKIPDGQRFAWSKPEPLRVAMALHVLAGVTCEWWVMTEAVAGIEISPGLGAAPLLRGGSGDEPRGVTPREARAKILAALRAQGITLKPQAVTRLSGGRPSVPAALDPGRDIQCEGTRCTITRALVDRLLGDTTALATAARFVPAIKDERPYGFKLYAIREGSVFARLGLENGDTVRAINALDMSTPDHALEVYSKLRDASQLTVTIERRGEPLTLEWDVVAP